MDNLAFLSPCRCSQVSVVMQGKWLPTTDFKIQDMPVTIPSTSTTPPVIKTKGGQQRGILE